MPGTAHASSDSEQRVKAILAVEDDYKIGAMLVDVFRMEPSWQIFLVTNATQALEAVETFTPDLFVLDYHLPGIDGLELADRLHAIEKLKHVPLLFLSANLPAQELEKRHIAFLQKPFELNTLFSVVRNLLP